MDRIHRNRSLEPTKASRKGAKRYPSPTTQDSQETMTYYQTQLAQVKKEISKVVVGQERIVDGLLKGLLANGHVLVEGIPGTAKTLLVKTLATTTGCTFKRVQFTVDLLPTDITGISAYDKTAGFYLVKGPVFSNFLLADEINRGTPKTQSALLEAMQEKQVTIGRETYPLERPFFVMATQNPIENIGVYELPEAQVDRFLLKLIISYPSLGDEKTIIDRNVDTKPFSEYGIRPILSPQKILQLQQITKQVFISDHLKDYITRLVDATRYPQKYGIGLGRYVDFGASPRASISMASAARAEAMLAGSPYVTDQHIKNIALDTLRHRIMLSYEGLASKMKTEDVINDILSTVEVIP